MIAPIKFMIGPNRLESFLARFNPKRVAVKAHTPIEIIKGASGL